jgi:lactoylglutathione lyase
MDIAFLGRSDTQVELIKEKGIELHSGLFQPNPAIKFIYILDPDGLKIQLVELLQTGG